MKTRLSKLKKILSTALCFLVINPIIAADTNEAVLQNLNVDKAIESALSREEKVGVLDKQIAAYEAKIKVIDDPIAASHYSNVYSRDQAVQKKAFIKDIVTYNVSVLYDAIIMLKEQIEFNDESIEVSEKELKQAQIRQKVGQISQFDLSRVELQVEQQRVQRQKNIDTLKDYKSQFYTLTGLNLDDYDEMEVDLTYEGLDEQIDSHITWSVGYYLANTDKFLEYQRTHIVEVTQSTYGDIGLPIDVIYATEAQVAESSYNTSQQKKNLLQTLQTTKVGLEKLQQTIAMQEEELKSQKTNLEMVQIKYAKGYATQLEVQKAEQAINQIELEKTQNIYSYNEQKMVLEKPWVKY